MLSKLSLALSEVSQCLGFAFRKKPHRNNSMKTHNTIHNQNYNNYNTITTRTYLCIAQRSGAMAWGSTSRAPALSHRSYHNHNHAIGQGRWSGAQLLEHRPDRTGLTILIIIQSVWGDGLGLNFSGTDRTGLSTFIIIESVWGDGLGLNFSSTDPIAPIFP